MRCRVPCTPHPRWPAILSPAWCSDCRRSRKFVLVEYEANRWYVCEMCGHAVELCRRGETGDIGLADG